MSTGQKSDSQNFLREVALRVWLGIKGRVVHAYPPASGKQYPGLKGFKTETDILSVAFSIDLFHHFSNSLMAAREEARKFPRFQAEV